MHHRRLLALLVVGPWALTACANPRGSAEAAGPAASAPRGVERQHAISGEADSLVTHGRPDEVLVRVNGRGITREQFIDRSIRKLGEVTLLSDLVRDELFLQEAERLGIEASAEEVEGLVDREIESMARALGDGSYERGRQRLEDLYRRQGLTVDDARADLHPRLELQLLVRKVTRALRVDDEAALRAFYDERRQFDVRHIYYSFPRFVDEPTAEQAAARAAALERGAAAVRRLRAGEVSFEELARTESDDALTRHRGGRIGPIDARAPLDPAIKQAIFRLEPGQVSDPVENPVGAFHVFQVIRIEPEEPFEVVRAQLEAEYRQRDPDLREMREVFDRLRDRSDLEWLPERGSTSAARSGPR